MANDRHYLVTQSEYLVFIYICDWVTRVVEGCEVSRTSLLAIWETTDRA